MKVTRLFDLLDRLQYNYAQKTDILAGKEKGIWRKYSVNEFIEITNTLSCALLSLGLKQGNKIITIINNRPEWNFFDMAIQQIGCIHIPVYPTISKDDYEYIFKHAEPSMVVIANKSVFDKIKGLIASCEIQHVYSIDEVNDIKPWTELMNIGSTNKKQNLSKVIEIKQQIHPQDIATIIYTSGTTGNPKGVMLSHWNILSNVIATSKVHKLDSNTRALSFLPLSHIYERMLNYHYLYLGFSIYYAENMGTIAENLKEVKPHIFCAVPRIFEVFFEKIQARGHDLSFLARHLFFYAIESGLNYKLEKENNSLYRLKFKLLDLLVYKKIRESLGGQLQIVVSGGAALQPRLGRLFWAAGVKLLEGYGLSETSPVIAVNRLAPSPQVMIGTVGPIIEGVDVKIADDGEILVKGPNVMQGYYKEPKLTSEVIDKDGWFHTGDVGMIVNNVFLKITDRKKEIFKLSSGKYIAPQPIENMLKESEFIEQAIVIGENEKFASAIIQPNFYYLHSWCAFRKIHFIDNSDLIKHPTITELYQKIVNEINLKLGQTEQIKRIRLIPDTWSYETGELSPTLKLKRKFIMHKYRKLINEIYQKD